MTFIKIILIGALLFLTHFNFQSFSQSQSHSNKNEHAHAHDHPHSHSHSHPHAHQHLVDPHLPPRSIKIPLPPDSKQTTGQTWINDILGQLSWLKGFSQSTKAIVAVGLISIAPNVALLVVPVERSREFQPRLRMMLAFGAGALLGDAFLHLIPHALLPHDHGHGRSHEHKHEHSHAHAHGHAHAHHDEHEHVHEDSEHQHKYEVESQAVRVGIWVLAGLLTFLSVELLVHWLKALTGHTHSHSHSHSSEHIDMESEVANGSGTSGQALGKGEGATRTGRKHTKNPAEPKRYSGSGAKGGNFHSHSETESESDQKNSAARQPIGETSESLRHRKNLNPSASASSEQADTTTNPRPSSNQSQAPKQAQGFLQTLAGMRASGWLNLVADFVHNSTDGLAVGAAFLAGDMLGLSAAVAILLHELPHELADLAILMQAGCTKRAAILLQFTTAFGAMAGCFTSLYLGAREAALLSASSEGGSNSDWIMPFTAGGFIYIAMVTILPDLLESPDFVCESEPDSSNVNEPMRGNQSGSKKHMGALERAWRKWRIVFSSLVELALLVLGVLAMWGVGLVEAHEH